MKNGFTLAEVLITLVVIGIVAALSIPALLQNTQKAEFVAAMKKSIADFNQAATLIKIDNAGSLIDGIGTTDNTFMQTFCSKISCVRQCLTGSTECFTNNWKTLHGSTGWVSAGGYPSAILNNGSTVYFTNSSPTCTSTSYTTNGEASLCGWFMVDVNGFKGPNIAGRDIFVLALTKNGVVPNEVTNAGKDYMSRCDPTQSLTRNGNYCATRIMKEGGMNY